MTNAQSERVRLIDQADGPGRAIATLVASLAASLAALHFVSGADAVGSLTAGFAALGREVSRTAQGARLRKAIEAGRAGMNGNLLWTSLRVGEWSSTIPPAHVLDQLRNSFALLLADDLEATLELMPILSQMAGALSTQKPEPTMFVDCLLGLWSFSQELVRTVELLAAPTLAPPGIITSATAPSTEPEGPLLR